MILDLFSDGSAVFSKIVSLLRLSLLGVALNVFATSLATISNAMNELELES